MDVRERIKEFTREFKIIYEQELKEVLSKNKELTNVTKNMLYDTLQSQIFGSNLLEKYIADNKLLSFLENNSNLKGKSLTRFLWFYFKKKLNQDLVEFFSKELGGIYWISLEKAIKETNNKVIKLSEKEILNNKKREISH